MIPKNEKTLFLKIDETKDSAVNYLLWHKKRTIEGNVVKTIYYVCSNKLKFGCTGRLRTTYNLIDSVLSVFTNEVHSEECFYISRPKSLLRTENLYEKD